MRGNYLSVPKNRRLVLDVCWAAKMVPAFPVDRQFELGLLQEARKETRCRISWVALYLKAYGLVCQSIPELRQTFVSYPWNYFYEHPHSIASISVHRDDPEGGKRLIWARIPNPENRSLVDIQARIDQATHQPLDEFYKDAILLERLPNPLRKILWWLLMQWQGRRRAKKVGTFSVSTLAGQDAYNRGHPLVVTTSLAYSRCDEHGSSLVTLIADHRVIDGVHAAHALQRLEETLNSQVLEEVRNLKSRLANQDRENRFKAA